MIDIITGDIKKIDAEWYESHLALLPSWMAHTISKYRVRDDRYRTLLGKMILLDYLQKNTDYNLEAIKFSEFKKPYLPKSNINFNISHSGDFTLVIFSDTQNRVGIDVEEVKHDIDLSDYKDVFLPHEFAMIQNSHEKIKNFYKMWTTKEAVLKAQGEGFMRNPKDVQIHNKKAYFDNTAYNIHSFEQSGYRISIAYEKNEALHLSDFCGH